MKKSCFAGLPFLWKTKLVHTLDPPVIDSVRTFAGVIKTTKGHGTLCRSCGGHQGLRYSPTHTRLESRRRLQKHVSTDDILSPLKNEFSLGAPWQLGRSMADFTPSVITPHIENNLTLQAAVASFCTDITMQSLLKMVCDWKY